jgi:hypothetical protein
MNIVRIPTLWTVYIGDDPGPTRRPNTWLAYARSLLPWLKVCVENGWDWATASEEHLAAWRNHLLAGRRDRTKGPYARSTVISSIQTWLGRWGTRVSTSAIRSEFRRALEHAMLTEVDSTIYAIRTQSRCSTSSCRTHRTQNRDRANLEGAQETSWPQLDPSTTVLATD